MAGDVVFWNLQGSRLAEVLVAPTIPHDPHATAQRIAGYDDEHICMRG